MRAGKLDRIITLQAYGAGEPDDYGVSQDTWGDAVTLRAQIVQQSTDEMLKASGETSEEKVVFRTRWRDGITTSHRVGYQGRFFDIEQTKEIGRREGLELMCREVRS